jgi:hypothetical protein
MRVFWDLSKIAYLGYSIPAFYLLPIPPHTEQFVTPVPPHVLQGSVFLLFFVSPVPPLTTFPVPLQVWQVFFPEPPQAKHLGLIFFPC